MKLDSILLNQILNDHSSNHSDLQIESFNIATNGITEYGQYIQTIRELKVRYGNLKRMYCEKELLEVDLEELQCNKDFANNFDKKRNEINIKKKFMSLEDISRNIKDSETEFYKFYLLAKDLKSKIGELTEERKNQLDKEMWLIKIKLMAATDLKLCGNLRSSTIEMINFLPEDMKSEIIKCFDEKDFVSKYLTFNFNNLKLPQKSELINVKMLLSET